MFEGGMAGASATALAADRRTSAQRLLTEAARLEEVAADERRVATQLSKLPASYSILHDLLVPGAEASFGHVVLGPGGVFLVVSHRHLEPIEFGPDVVRADDDPFMSAVRGVFADAQVLAEALGTPVAPVVALVGPETDLEMPVKVEGVTLAPIDRVARAVSRGSHTLLASRAIAEVSGRALPLLTTPSTVERTSEPEMSAESELPDPQPEHPSVIEDVPVHDSVAEVLEMAPHGAADRRRRWHMPTMLASAAVAAIGLIVFAAGSLVSTLGSSTTSRAAGIDIQVLVPAPSGAGASAVAAPRFRFTPECVSAGTGWQLRPERVDNGQGAAFYEVEARGVDGAWTRVATLASEAIGSARVLRLASGAEVDLRVTAIAADGRRSAAAAVVVTTPRSDC